MCSLHYCGHFGGSTSSIKQDIARESLRKLMILGLNLWNLPGVTPHASLGNNHEYFFRTIFERYVLDENVKTRKSVLYLYTRSF